MPTQFRKLLSGALDKEVIIPQIRIALFDPDFPEFNVPISGFVNRKPDDRFHPSEHPTWSEEDLYQYLIDPTFKREDRMNLTGIFSVTQGNFWHAFIQTLGITRGWLRQATPDAHFIHDRAEFWVEDKELGTGGHMDGILNSDILNLSYDEGFEMKTMNGFKASKCPKGPPDSTAKIHWFKFEKPTYYAQAQEYMRMSGLMIQRVLILTLEYPFPMIEIAVPFDPEYSKEITDKYRKVRKRVSNE